MESKTRMRPHWFNRLLIFTLVALLAVGAVALATESNTDAPVTLQMAASQEGERQELSTRDMAQQNLPSIVSISTEAITTLPDYGYSNPFGYGFGYGYGRQTPREYRSVGAGSGIIISEDGYILTNSHVISGASTIQVTLNDDTTYDAQLVGADVDNDIAILKINANGLTPATFGDSDDLMIGETAMVIGNPLGEVNGSVSVGVISALPRTITIDGRDMMLMQTDAAINPGNSGGAIINSYGEVVGIVTAKTAAVQVEGIGYAIPINNVKEKIEDLISGTPQTASSDTEMRLGVSVRDVTEELAAQNNLPVGVYILDVEAFSAAERAGIQRGDVIISLAGQDARSHAALEEVKKSLNPGDEQDIVVVRNGEELTLKITLGTAHSA